MSPTRPSLDSLLTDCDRWRLTVALTALPRTVRGAYHHATRTIVLRAGMPEWMAVPTLMHEMEHARRGDEGPQPRSVEARIDRAVAHRLISVGDYRAAEAAVGPHPGAIAVALDLPRWVVDAYRSALRGWVRDFRPGPRPGRDGRHPDADRPGLSAS